jgi:hypothetical protein
VANREKQVVRYRVRKEDVQVSAAVKKDGLAECLECWKDWMLSDDRDLSASRMKLHAGDRDEDEELEGYESDPYAEQRRDDMKVGEATGAMIEELKPVWRWAIHKKMGVCQVWRFESADFLSSLEQAQAELERKLRNHIATAMKFI